MNYNRIEEEVVSKSLSGPLECSGSSLSRSSAYSAVSLRPPTMSRAADAPASSSPSSDPSIDVPPCRRLVTPESSGAATSSSPASADSGSQSASAPAAIYQRLNVSAACLLAATLSQAPYGGFVPAWSDTQLSSHRLHDECLPASGGFWLHCPTACAPSGDEAS